MKIIKRKKSFDKNQSILYSYLYYVALLNFRVIIVCMKMFKRENENEISGKVLVSFAV